jgi:predicted ribosome quality control (RQC) complex YloA/Tae2 family protein
VPSPLTDAERERLLGELGGLRSANLQKLWLPSPKLCVLQLRLPGRTQLVVVDARLEVAALADERPTSPEGAPRSQATLRHLLEGGRLEAVRLRTASDRKAPSPWLEFETPQGPRALVAEEALLVVAGDGRVLWASSGAVRRPGSAFPATAETLLSESPPLPGRTALLRESMRGEEERGVAARRRELVARLKSRAVKARRTLTAVEADQSRAADAAADRARAELLLPHASRIPRGATEARLPDWSRTDEQGNPAEVVLQLDPASSAAEHAARWLKRARRYQAAQDRIAARHEQVRDELSQAELLLARAQAAADAAALAAVEAELGPSALPRVPKKDAPRLPYRVFQAQSGAKVLVGRSARDNDALTFRVARGNDVWLHARSVKGAHVVLPGAGESPDARTLGDAALLAAHFSSLRGESGAEVAWTRCKYVRKPRGAAPGSVLVSQEKTLRVRLDEERLAQLLKSEPPG